MISAEIQTILARAANGAHATRMAVVESLERADYSWPRTARMRILRNYTLEPLESFLKLACYRRDVRLQLSYAGYDTYQQEALDPNSELNRIPPDAVVLSLWLDTLPMAFDVEWRLQSEAVIEHVSAVVAQVRARVPSLIFINTFLPSSHQLGYPYSDEGRAGLRAVNAAIKKLAVQHTSLFVVDFEALQSVVGVKGTRDLRYWFMYRSPLAPEFMSLWADILAQAVSSARGGVKKVLAVDCDDTLWGGIVGEDGLSGIRLGAFEYPGNVFMTFQRQLLELQRQGTLLVICSKNNEGDVLEVLDQHPDCVLRRRHFAAWRINWQDKATNLKELADELRLGLDSFVFVDDDPVEIELVRKTLPMVDVLEIPRALHTLPKLLATYSGFFSISQTAEDLLRTEHYGAERGRRCLSSAFADHGAFLASLELVAEVGVALPDEFGRVAQLTQKTNQFNLTTRRYTHSEIEEFAVSPRSAVLVLKARDKYGEYGLTGVAILAAEGGSCCIDTFLLSCRILGRHLEDVLLDEAIEIARKRWQVVQVTGEIVSTPKNGQVTRFYGDRGFEVVSRGELRTLFRIAVDAYRLIRPAVVSVRRRGSEWKSE